MVSVTVVVEAGPLPLLNLMDTSFTHEVPQTVDGGVPLGVGGGLVMVARVGGSQVFGIFMVRL